MRGRSLNAQTVPDRYPIPHIQDFMQRLAGSKFFSKIDLLRAYYQIPLLHLLAYLISLEHTVWSKKSRSNVSALYRPRYTRT